MSKKEGSITPAGIADANRAVYERRSVSKGYARAGDLHRPEAVILEQYKDDFVGKSALDIGVGGGRTAPWLAGTAATYTGIDFSEEMVRTCRERYPQWKFQWGDARDLSDFASSNTDFVLFSFNGIDYVAHEDRLEILREVMRVLLFCTLPFANPETPRMSSTSHDRMH